MSQFNIKPDQNIDNNYQNGFLPQRNDKNLFYFQTSCRSDLNNFKLSSENRRIINKTTNFTFEKVSINNFNYTFEIQKEINTWVKNLKWDFPVSSIKNVFTNHIFNYVYIWKNENNEIIAYSLCYFSKNISHIAYVFYNPDYAHGNLPIRLVLQTIIDSEQLGLKYCYLGRFSQETGYYKRNMPGFEYFESQNWIKYEK